EENDNFRVRVPTGAAKRRQRKRGERPQVAPAIGLEVVGPDGALVQVDLAVPLPAVAGAEGGEAQVAGLERVVDVLLGAADARRRRVGLLERPLPAEGVASPALGALLAAAPLVVAAIAQHDAVRRIPDAVALVAEPRRRRRARGRGMLGPAVEGV